MSDVIKKQEENFFGVHFMIDGYDAPKEALKDIEKLKSMLETIPAHLGMHTISKPLVVKVGPKNSKDPGGVSGFVMIAESHISFHTFPNKGFVTIDVYTCQNHLDTHKLLARFKKVFQFKNEETHFLKRGTRYPVENIY